jgi:hypothetical protein
VQIIKVWLDHGAYKEKVFDVALSGGRHDDASGHAPPVGSTVNMTTGAYANSIGAGVLGGVWRDPEFDPKVPAVYYARALEIPTPRWTMLLAIRNHLPVPTRMPPVHQERAWTSPIWFTPPGAAHAGSVTPQHVAARRPAPGPAWAPPPPGGPSVDERDGDYD